MGKLDLDDIAKRIKELDCGDSSCEFAKNKGGMRTNGGCRCLDPSRPTREVRVAAKLMPDLLEENNKLRVGLREALRCLDLAGKAESFGNEKHFWVKTIEELKKLLE